MAKQVKMLAKQAKMLANKFEKFRTEMIFFLLRFYIVKGSETNINNFILQRAEYFYRKTFFHIKRFKSGYFTEET